MVSIKSLYKRIHDKLSLWTKFKKMSRKHKDEICHLVASFFTVLDSNEGDNFQLVYDDLPIYYVPEKLKDRLYLMTNLLTKYQVTDRLAFPLLLRGLDKT